MLDSAVGKTNEQAKIFRNLLQRATAKHMKWLVQIILKNLRVRGRAGP